MVSMALPAQLALAVLCTAFVHSLVMINHQNIPAMDGVLPSSGYLVNHTAWSLIQCAQLCTRTNGSRSFFHVQTSGTCQCHGGLFHDNVTQGLTENVNAKYYEHQGTVGCQRHIPAFRDVVLSDGSKLQYRIFSDTLRMFNESVAKCADEGSRLLQVTTPEKLNFAEQLMACWMETNNVMDWLRSKGWFNYLFWVDGMYNLTTSTWETEAGDPLPDNPDYWFYDETPHDNYTHPRCVSMFAFVGARWLNIYCNETIYTICERF